MFNNENEFEKLINRLDIDDKPNDFHREGLRREMFSAFNQTRAKTPHAGFRQIVWRIIMESRISKLAAAAVIIIAVMAGIHHFGGSIDGSSVAWASVLENIENAPTLSYRIITSVSADNVEITQAEIVVYNSLEFGMRNDTYVNGNLAMTGYILVPERLIVMVLPAQKQYMRMNPTEEQFQQALEELQGPREIVKQFKSAPYKEIGTKVINGIEAQGIEVETRLSFEGAEKSMVARLWINPETQMPILMETEGLDGIAPQIRITIEEFELDPEFEPEIFEPNIPDDYTPIEVPTDNVKVVQ